MNSKDSEDGEIYKSMESSVDEYGDNFEDEVDAPCSDEEDGTSDEDNEESETSESEDGSDISKDDVDIYTNRITEMQGKIAAAVTVVILVILWKLECRSG